MTVGELAEALDGKLIGDPSLQISRVEEIQRAGKGAITFLASPRYAEHLSRTKASAIILPKGTGAPAGIAAIVCVNPYLAFAKAVELLHPASRP